MYGGKAKIPENTHILIAGFACDDFSPLNNVPKTLEEKGESGDTFYAILAFAELYSPPIIVLENVMNAPWTDEQAKNWKNKEGQVSIRRHFSEIGYETIYLKMDTKNYYLPHTRNRGYLIAIHRESMDIGPRQWAALIEECRNMIAALQHTATVPLEALLFASDDPRLEVLEQERKTDNKTVKWDRCKIGHHDYCLNLALGDKHPLSGWKSDGSKELPDFHRSMPGITERVVDSLDIAHKRNLVRGFDDRYYR
jgi:site-specific DNA-cytosine methylase